jgi:superfamily II DNA or RNA helicase
MIIIEVGDIYCKMLVNYKDDLAVISLVRDVCRARPNGFRFMPKFKAGQWDGYISLMQGFNSFPTGLLEQVMEMLADQKYDVNLVWNSLAKPYKQITTDALAGVDLRDYQIEAANILLESHRGVAGMATNSGKTEVMAALAWALDSEIIIIESSIELMYQTAERLAKRLPGKLIGIVGDGKWQPMGITVAMVQTLSNKLNLASVFHANQCIMVDECHHASSDTMLDVLSEIPGPYRFGFSGTPLKHDVLQDLKLMAYTGPVKYWVSNDYLIAEGYSAKPNITMLEIQPDRDDMWDARYPDAYDALIVENSSRNASIAKLVADQQDAGITLILVEHIQHGQLLSQLIAGSAFVHGSDPIEKRKAVLKDMADGKQGVYIASPIFDEGVDVPAVDQIIIAGGGKSNVKLLQRVGRGMRKKTNNTLSVIDFIDLGNKYLLNHTEARLDVYTQEGFKVSKRAVG